MVKKNCKLKSHRIYIPMNIKLGKKKNMLSKLVCGVGGRGI